MEQIKNGKFSVNSEYKELNSGVVKDEDWSWKPNIRYKVNCFTWFLAKEAVLTYVAQTLSNC